MNQKNINEIQNKIIKLLDSHDKNSLKILSQHCCSEVARLVGSWIEKNQKPSQILILKGESLTKDNASHDVLAIVENKEITVIDPTVWQFFPNNNILVGNFNTLEAIYSKLDKTYGGKWKISEKLENITDTQIIRWKNIIRKNLNENILELEKMKIDKTKFKKELKNFDINSDYYIAVIPDNESINRIAEILNAQKSFIEENKLTTRPGDYLHMTVIYLPSINKINQELVKINVNAKLTKEKLFDFINDLLRHRYTVESYAVFEVGYLGKRSISLWMKGNVLPIHIKAIEEFKKIIMGSGLSEKEFKMFIDQAGFSVLKYYCDSKFLPHVGIVKVPKNIDVSKGILRKLTKLYKNMKIKVNKIELRKNN
jgi:hypothetical protein